MSDGFPVPLTTADFLDQWFGPQSFSQPRLLRQSTQPPPVDQEQK